MKPQFKTQILAVGALALTFALGACSDYYNTGTDTDTATGDGSVSPKPIPRVLAWISTLTVCINVKNCDSIGSDIGEFRSVITGSGDFRDVNGRNAGNGIPYIFDNTAKDLVIQPGQANCQKINVVFTYTNGVNLATFRSDGLEVQSLSYSPLSAAKKPVLTFDKGKTLLLWSSDETSAVTDGGAATTTDHLVSVYIGSDGKKYRVFAETKELIDETNKPTGQIVATVGLLPTSTEIDMDNASIKATFDCSMPQGAETAPTPVATPSPAAPSDAGVQG